MLWPIMAISFSQVNDWKLYKMILPRIKLHNKGKNIVKKARSTVKNAYVFLAKKSSGELSCNRYYCADITLKEILFLIPPGQRASTNNLAYILGTR